MDAGNPKLKVTLLGGFVVEYEGQIISSLAPRADSLWILFRYLLASRGKYITSDSLIDMLWSEDEVVNPRKALQNLIYRLRKQLPEADENGRQYILSQHRAYGWNPEALVCVDAQEFETIATKIKGGLPETELAAAAKRLMSVYAGDYMEDIADQSWVESYTAYYKRLFFDCMNIYVNTLFDQRHYADAVEACSIAIKHNMFDEHYHAAMIRAMLALGNRYGALTHYKSIVSILKRELGVEPSDELKAAGQSIHSISQPQRPDISMVLDDLRSASAASGPMICEMDVFRQIFQLQERKNRREQSPCMLVMYTIVAHSRELSDQEMFQAMSALKRASMLSLRKSDVVTQHSNTQLLLLLPASNEVTISIVLMRIQQKFNQLCLEDDVTLTTQVRSIQPRPLTL
ncbi:MAG: winged helix-turn-helix domain-containing protein [Clostridiales bacterium]|jgi:DNA-binding SARP family transcriptional activator|nr:winged helix-turn-helix domain-containing protein [Clostridiales bacterium]